MLECERTPTTALSAVQKVRRVKLAFLNCDCWQENVTHGLMLHVYLSHPLQLAKFFSLLSVSVVIWRKLGQNNYRPASPCFKWGPSDWCTEPGNCCEKTAVLINSGGDTANCRAYVICSAICLDTTKSIQLYRQMSKCFTRNMDALINSIRMMD